MALKQLPCGAVFLFILGVVGAAGAAECSGAGESCSAGVRDEAPGAEAAQAEAEAAEPLEGQAAAFLDCEGLGEEHVFWPLFRDALRTGGFLGPATTQLAYLKWSEWESVIEKMASSGELSGKLSVVLPGVQYANGTTMETPIWDRLDLLKAFQRSRFQALFGRTFSWNKDYLAGFLACPIAFVLVHYVVFMVHKARSALPLEERKMNWEGMVNAFGYILGTPAYALDFLESSNWGISSHDIAVNLNIDDGVVYNSYDEFCRAHPVPPPVLKSWAEDSPELAQHFGASLQSDPFVNKRVCRSDEGGALRLALIGEHGAVNLDHLSSAKAALRDLCSGEYVEGQATGQPEKPSVRVDAAHFFTYLWSLAGTDEGDSLKAGLRMTWEAFWGEPLTESAGRQSSRFSTRWTVVQAIDALRLYASNEPFLRRAQVLVCCDPLWMCFLLHAAIGSARLLVRASMCLLHGFSHMFETSELEDFWQVARHFVASTVPGSVSTLARISAEMLAYQIGMRIPYVPAMSLHLSESAPYSPSKPDVLLFRSHLPGAPSFRRLLKLMAVDEPKAPKIVDMVAVMSFRDIASFRAVIQLPHVPFALRLADVYAMAVPTLVPADPLIHKFVWPYAGPFCGRTEPDFSRSVDPLALNRSQPPYSPFDFQSEDYAPDRFHNDRRYWLQYTEWELRPHLLRFRSMPHLFQLASFSQEEAFGISSRMRRHHSYLVREAMSYWRAVIVAVTGDRIS